MQVPRLLSTAELAVEVRRLLRLQQARTRRPAPEPVDLCPKDKRANLLLKWSQAACGLHGMRIHDVTTSFGDGRALCYLVGMRARVCACLCAAVCLGLLGVVRLPGVCVFDWLGAGLGGCGPGVLMPCVCVCAHSGSMPGHAPVSFPHPVVMGERLVQLSARSLCLRAWHVLVLAHGSCSSGKRWKGASDPLSPCAAPIVELC